VRGDDPVDTVFHSAYLNAVSAPRISITILLIAFAAVLPLRCGGAEDEIPELAQMRAGFERDVDFATAPFRSRYISKLESLKRTLGARGDARGAAAVQDEIAGVAASGAGFAKFAGVWDITYSRGATKRCLITTEGAVTCDENDGKRMPEIKGKLIVKNTDVLVDFKNGIIERIRRNGRNLILERFDPKELYPGRFPSVMGSGTASPNR
jgi:hypothetical protein